MTYPTITAKKAILFRDKLLLVPEAQRLSAEIDQTDLVENRSGDFDESSLLAESDAICSEWEAEVKRRGEINDDDLYELEVRFAEKIFKAIERISLDCLEDEDFWRYLALVPFRWYLLARERELKPQDFGGLTPVPVLDRFGKPELDEHRVPKTRLAKTGMVNQVVYRTYLIGKAMEDKSSHVPFERATAIARRGPITDVWQSHIIRVQIGRIGVLRHAFVDRVKTEKNEQKNFARELAKLLTRLKNNVLLDHQTKRDSDAIISGISEKAKGAVEELKNKKSKPKRR